MKTSEFRKLIREEVRKVLKEAAGKAYALVIDEDGNFIQEDLASYSQDEYVDLDGPKITAAKAAKFPTDYDAWANAPELAKTENQKWLQAISKLGTNYDYYDILSDGGQNAVIAVVPKGTSPSDYSADGEAGGETSKSVSLNPNDLYTVSVGPTSIIGPNETFIDDPKALAMRFAKNDGDIVKKLDKDTYIHYDKDIVSFDYIGVIGKPKDNPEFWQAVSTGNKALAFKLATDMKKTAKLYKNKK